MSKKKGFVIGALVGSAIGATAALLFAPKTGKEMRKDIADKSHDLYDKGVLIAGEVKDKGGDVLQEVKEKGGLILSDVKEVGLEMKEKGGSILSDVKEAGLGVKDSVVEKSQEIKGNVTTPEVTEEATVEAVELTTEEKVTE